MSKVFGEKKKKKKKQKVCRASRGKQSLGWVGEPENKKNGGHEKPESWKRVNTNEENQKTVSQSDSGSDPGFSTYKLGKSLYSSKTHFPHLRYRVIRPFTWVLWELNKTVFSISTIVSKYDTCSQSVNSLIFSLIESERSLNNFIHKGMTSYNQASLF